MEALDELPKKNVSVVFGAAVCAWLLNMPLLARHRDTLPEPLDVLDHVGNVPNSLALGMICAVGITMYNRLHSDTDSRLGRRAAAAAGLLVGAAVNLAYETKFGQQLPFSGTSDEIDMLYGTVSATLASTYSLPPRAQALPNQPTH